MKNKFYGALGLCARAGALVTGEAAVEKLVRSGKCKLALIDGGASKNAAKAIGNACETYSARLLRIAPDALGDAIGRPGRMAAATADAGFAAKLINEYQLLSGVQGLDGENTGTGRDQGT